MADRGHINPDEIGDGHYIGTKNTVGNQGEALLMGGGMYVGPETVYGNPGRSGRLLRAKAEEARKAEEAKKNDTVIVTSEDPLLEIKEETSELDLYIELARCFSGNLRKETIVLSDSVPPGKTYEIDGARVINREDWKAACSRFVHWVMIDLTKPGPVRVQGFTEPSPAAMQLVSTQEELDISSPLEELDTKRSLSSDDDTLDLT